MIEVHQITRESNRFTDFPMTTSLLRQDPTESKSRSRPAMPNESDADALTKHLWKRRQTTIYRVRLSTLYHLKRERFFDSIDKFTSAATAVTASAAVATLLKRSTDVELGTAVATAILSMIPLIWNPAQKARHHAQLASDFRRLLAECEHAGERWEEERCNLMTARAVEIEAGEPAPLAALVADCENQLAISLGKSPVAHLRWHERLLKHWFDFRPLPADQNGKRN